MQLERKLLRLDALIALRCKACNNVLTDSESTAKNPTTGDYDDLCKHCVKTYAYTDDLFEEMDSDLLKDWRTYSE